MSSPLETVATYFIAKDGNRPHLMRRVFAEDAELEMVSNTDAISFPASTKGADAISEILGRRFSADFDNVYTFALTRPAAADRNHFPCHWMVGMSAKKDGSLRVGTGHYDWYFTPDDRCLVSRLKIKIEMMHILPEAHLTEIMQWLSSLPYPWCAPDEMIRTMPKIGSLTDIGRYLEDTRHKVSRS